MTFSRAVAATTVGLVTLVAVVGCGRLGQSELEFDRTEDVKIEMIRVEPGAGDVVIRTAPVSNVRIKRVVRYRGSEPGETYRIEGDVLTIDTNCGHWCSVSYDITAPPEVKVGGENGSGDVTLIEVGRVDIKVGSGSVTVDRPAKDINVVAGSGDITVSDGRLVAARTGSGSITVRTVSIGLFAQTGSGDITVTDTDGPATLKTGSGSIEARGLDGGKVEAETGSGEIDLTLVGQQSVRAHSGSGEVWLTVPAGAYRVDARTRSGTVDVTVTDDPSATHVLDVSTGSGDVTVRQGL